MHAFATSNMCRRSGRRRRRQSDRLSVQLKNYFLPTYARIHKYVCMRLACIELKTWPAFSSSVTRQRFNKRLGDECTYVHIRLA